MMSIVTVLYDVLDWYYDYKSYNYRICWNKKIRYILSIKNVRHSRVVIDKNTSSKPISKISVLMFKKLRLERFNQ